MAASLSKQLAVSRAADDSDLHADAAYIDTKRRHRTVRSLRY